LGQVVGHTLDTTGSGYTCGSEAGSYLRLIDLCVTHSGDTLVTSGSGYTLYRT